MNGHQCCFLSSAGRLTGHNYKTSHIADTWRCAGTAFVHVCVCRQKERERSRKAFVSSHIDLPQGSLGNYREAGVAPPTLRLWNLLNGKVQMLRSPPPPLQSLCVQINDCLLQLPCILDVGQRGGKGRAAALTAVTTCFWCKLVPSQWHTKERKKENLEAEV